MNEQGQTILVVDEDADFRAWAIKQLTTPGTRVFAAARADEAYRLYRAEEPDLLIADTHLQPFGGLELLSRIREPYPNAFVILTSALGTTQNVIEAMKLGAFDFLRKESLPFHLKVVADAALRQLEETRQALPAGTDSPGQAQGETIIGQSAAMQEVFKMIGRVARSNAPVLITGESGTGKEVVARAIHQYSPRHGRQFVAINCAAIPEALLESELFGHEKGAFTGAATQREGRFEQCAGGTLFLDEIGDMPLGLQSKILRVLQDGSFSRLGGNQTLQAEVRIVAATNRNPERQIAEKTFREDLFYRLNVVRIHLPALRERAEDIPLLAGYFLARTGKRLSREAAAAIQGYGWPGNVRELQNTIERASVLAASEVIVPKDLPLGIEPLPLEPGAPGTRMGKAEAVGALFRMAREEGKFALLPWVEREFTRLAMEETGGNQVQAARLLGITRATLRKRLEHLRAEAP